MADNTPKETTPSDDADRYWLGFFTGVAACVLGRALWLFVTAPEWGAMWRMWNGG